MAPNIGEATVRIVADATPISRSLERGLKAAFAGAAVAAVTAGLGKIAIDGTKAANTLEKNFLRTFQLLPTFSKQAYDELEDLAFGAANRVGVGVNEIANSIYEAVGAGFEDLTMATNMAEVAAKAARASGSSALVVMDGLTSVMNAYGHEAYTAQEVSDVLFQTFNFGKASIDELAGSVYDVVPVAAGLGISFNEVGASLALLTSTGIKAHVATTQLRQAFNELGRTGSKANLNFRAISGVAFPDFIKQGGTVIEAVRVMEKRAKELNEPLQNLFVSASTGGAAFNVMSKRMSRFQKLLEAFDPSQIMGKSDRAFEIAMLGMEARLERARSRFDNARIKVFSDLKPVTDAFGQLYADALNAIAGALQSHSEQISDFGERLGKSLQGVATSLQSTGEVIGPIMEAIFTRIGQGVEALDALISEVGPLLAPLFQGTENMPGVIEVFQNISTSIGGVIDALIGAMPAFSAFFQGIMSVAGPAIASLLWLANKVIPAVFDALATAINWLSKFETVWGAVGAALGVVGGAWLGAIALVTAFWKINRIGVAVIGRVMGALRALWVVMAANPIGAVVVIIGALIAAFVYAWKNSETFQRIVKRSFNAVVTAIGAAVKAVVTVVHKWVDTWLSAFALLLKAWAKMPKILGGGVASRALEEMNKLRGQISDFVDGVNSQIDRIVDRVHLTITADASQAFRTVEAYRQALGGIGVFIGKGQTPTGFSIALDNGAGFTSGADIFHEKLSATPGGGGGGGGGGGLGPSGTDFGDDSKKAAKKAAATAAKALTVSFKAIGKALDAIAKKTGEQSLDKIRSLFDAASEKIRDSIEKAGEAGNKTMEKVLRNQLKALNKQEKRLVTLAKRRDAINGKLFGNKYNLAEAKDLLADLRKESSAFVASTKAAIISLGNLTNDTGGLASTFTGMRNNLRKAIVQTKAFHSAIYRLEQLNLNETALKQLSEAFQSDPTEGLRQAQLLARGGTAAVGEINKLQTQLEKAAGGLAWNLNNEFHTAGIQAAKGLVQGLQSQHNVIVKQMDKIADALVDRVKKRLKIKSPSGVFDEEVGAEMPAGIVQGVRRTLPAALREVHNMSEQMINFGPGSVQVNGVGDPAAAQKAGILTGHGIAEVVERRRTAAQMMGVR